MRIISKYQDYYDSALGYGHDEHTVYVRSKYRTVPENPTPLIEYMFKVMDGYEIKDTNRKGIDFTIDYGILGFCGKLYPFIEVNWTQGLYNVSDTPIKGSRVLYSEEDIVKFVHSKTFRDLVGGKKQQQYLTTVPYDKLTWANRRYSLVHMVRELKKIQAQLNIKSDSDVLDIFYQINAPSFTVRVADQEVPTHIRSVYYRRKSEISMMINPELKQVEFVRIMDPFTTFQEIDMFISGVLSSCEDGNIQIDDEHMLKAKGFYDMSFKKRPSE